MARVAPLSVSVRLAAWYAATLLLLLSAFAAFTYAAYQGAIRRSFERHLVHEWGTVAPLVRVAGDSLDVATLRRSPPVATRHAGDGATFVRVTDASGRVVYISPNTAEHAVHGGHLAPAGAPDVRTYRAPLRTADGRVAGWAEVAGAEWTRRDELRELAESLVGGVLLAVLVAMGAGWWLARRALRPVAVLTDAAARMADAAAPSARLPTAFDVRDELTRLAETFNGLLDRLERASARERRFTADAAHELLTPLATLRSEAEVALRRERDGGAYREVLAHVVDEAAQMAATVRALLQLARAEASAPVVGTAVDLSALVAERVDRVRDAAEAAGVTLAADLAPAAHVAAGEAPLAEVVDNLLANAVKYTPAGGRVAVRLTASPGRVRLTVADTGIGFDPTTGARLFERFFRADAPEVQRQPGSGLGLAIVRAVVDGLGGSVHATSDGPGRGATVTVDLPAAEPAAAEPPARS